MSILIQDIRYGLRALLRQKSFATVAVLTLAIGIGANTAIFSLLNPLIFRPLPVPDAERLCRVFSGSGGNIYGRMSYPNYTDLRTSLQAFESLAASSWPVPFSMGLGTRQGGPSQTEVVWGAVVSGNYFTTLGVHTALGRAFLPEEDSVPDARPVVIVSHRLWETKLAADPRIIGYTLRLNSRDFTIIGVAAAQMPQTEPLFPAYPLGADDDAGAGYAWPSTQAHKSYRHVAVSLWSAPPRGRTGSGARGARYLGAPSGTDLPSRKPPADASRPDGAR